MQYISTQDFTTSNSYHHTKMSWNFEFSRPFIMTAAEKNLATSQKTFRPTTLAFKLWCLSRQFGQKNKKSNFHIFLHGDTNNPDAFLNQRYLYISNKVSVGNYIKMFWSLKVFCNIWQWKIIIFFLEVRNVELKKFLTGVE